MIIVDGIKFYSSGNGYLKNTEKGLWLHRYIWEKYNGPIPEGYVIHHKDHNKLNNDISNLEMISDREHRLEHPYSANKPLSKETYFKILDLYEAGYKNSDIQKIVGKCSATVYDCIHGRRNKKFYEEYYGVHSQLKC